MNFVMGQWFYFVQPKFNKNMMKSQTFVALEQKGLPVLMYYSVEKIAFALKKKGDKIYTGNEFSSY